MTTTTDPLAGTGLPGWAWPLFAVAISAGLIALIWAARRAHQAQPSRTFRAQAERFLHAPATDPIVAAAARIRRLDDTDRLAVAQRNAGNAWHPRHGRHRAEDRQAAA